MIYYLLSDLLSIHIAFAISTSLILYSYSENQDFPLRKKKKVKCLYTHVGEVAEQNFKP